MRTSRQLFQKFRNTVFALSTAVLIGSTGCRPSPTQLASQQIEGEWEITLWDMEDYEMADYFSKAVVEFEKAEEGDGQFHWKWQTDEGDCFQFEGDYAINDDADAIDFHTHFEDPIRDFFDLAFTVGENSLTMQGKGLRNRNWNIQAVPLNALSDLDECPLSEPIPRPDRLQGTWWFTSWIVDGVETLTDYRFVRMDFEPDANNEGPISWVFRDLNGYYTTWVGEYVVSDEANEVEMELGPRGGAYLYEGDYDFDVHVRTRIVLEGIGVSGKLERIEATWAP